MNVSKNKRIIYLVLSTLEDMDEILSVSKVRSKEEFLNNVVAKRGIGMCIIELSEQINNLDVNLIEDFPVSKEIFKTIRNSIAHSYVTVDQGKIYEIIVKNKKIISKYFTAKLVELADVNEE